MNTRSPIGNLRRLGGAGALVLALVGCAGGAPSAVPGPAEADLPKEIRWVRGSAEHRAAFLQTYAAASARLRELASGRPRGSWAVILDADETVLDNSIYQVRIARAGESFSSRTWYAWVREERATALPGASEFITLARDLGGRVVIVTNRDEVVCEPTRRNLEALGIAVDLVLCRQEGERGKEGRFDAVARGTAAGALPPLDVLLYVGDNIDDFPGVDQSDRSGPVTPFLGFGRRYFVLPNPMYGSWERVP